MAQLPPKAPNLPQNWPDFPHNNTSSWVDEFLDFSSARRGSHRRSMSDSVAFLEAPMVEECRRSAAIGGDGNANHNAGGEFERFDDEQFISMFADDVVPEGPCSNPSSPSDHHSMNDEEKMQRGPSDRKMQVRMKSEPEEVQSTCEGEDGFNHLHASTADNSCENIVDPKRIKRILANRQSAQRSRVRKLQYISELERSVTSLQAEVSVLSPRVAFLDHQRLVLNVDNSVLKQRIAALAQDKLFKDAHQEALKREIERLRQIYYEQNLKKMENPNSSEPKSPVASLHAHCPTHAPDKDQLAVN